MDEKCFRCGILLVPLSEIPLSTRIDMEQTWRERFPNTWQDGKEDKVRVCDNCNDELDSMETPEQYEIRKIMEQDNGQHTDRP